MKEEKNTPMTTTTVFNLIILDESGSMSHLTDATISGCNETLNLIRETAKGPGSAKMRQLVSIYAFQDGGSIKSRYLVKNVKPEQVADITRADYRPLGNTPLLDAVGSTLTELKAVAATHEDATGIITIITDGYENSSRQYSAADVARLISQFKEMGWTVNLIGANIDVESLGAKLHIDNRMSFSHSEAGTKAMWDDFKDNSRARYCEMALEAEAPMEERNSMRVRSSKRFFKK